MMKLLQLYVLVLLILSGNQIRILDHRDNSLPFNDTNETLNVLQHDTHFEQDPISMKCIRASLYTKKGTAYRMNFERLDTVNSPSYNKIYSSKLEDIFGIHGNFWDQDLVGHDMHNAFFAKSGSGTIRNIDIMNEKSSKCQATSLLQYRIQNLIHTFNENLTTNGKRFELNTESITVTIEKVSPNNIADKRLWQESGTKVRFPDLNLNQSVTIKLITLPLSSVVSLTLHDQHDRVIPVENTTSPFEIFIPRKANLLPAPMYHQNVSRLVMNSKFKYYYVNLTHDKNLSIALHIEIEPENKDVSYLFFIQLSAVPDTTDDLIDDWQLLCPKDREAHSSKYTFFVDNTRISHHQWAIFGIREMKKCSRHNLNENARFSTDFSIRMFTSGCYYLDDENRWQSDGLTVGSKTNETITHCYSTHLTTYAAAYVQLPSVPWKRLNFAFEKNMTIYITLILVGLIFVGFMVVAHFKDKIDAKMLVVIPLKDNNPRDRYLYQLVVFTGMRVNSGTRSKVHFIVSGNKDETSVRQLTAERRILNRGNVDSFIMAVPRSLGHLDYLRIWHDNSGSGADASWFLKYILVRDLQTMETSYFICERWLAVENGDGEIECTLNAAGELDKMELQHVLSKNAYRSMADNHLWFSIFAYHMPSAHRFTRIQRCTCCFVLFFLTLLMDLVLSPKQDQYNKTKGDHDGVSIGPFNFSKTSIGNGIIAELLIFLPSLILVALFRRSKERHPRKISPVGEAVENIRSKGSKNKKGIQPTKPPAKKFLLPWWCIIIAYVLSFLIIITSVAFILVLNVSYGDEAARTWLGSIFTSLFASILLTQPLKVLSLALLFAFLCRKKSQKEAFIEHEDPVEDFTVCTDDAHLRFPPKSLLGRTHIDPYRVKRQKLALEKLRAKRIKEVKAWTILRELFLLLLFLGVLYAISFANRDVQNANAMVRYLRHEYLKANIIALPKEVSREKRTQYYFEKMKSVKAYWEWLEEVFLGQYQNSRWNDETKNISRLQSATRVNRILGWPILRQLRVKNDSCLRKALHDVMTIDDCHVSYNWYNEAKTPFGFNLSSDATAQHFNQAFEYKAVGESSLIYSTASATYLDGGYIHEIRAIRTEDIQQGLRYLQNHHWIDRYTRAVFLTFGIFNPNINVFVHCTFLLEQLPATHQLVFTPSIQPLKLVQLYTGAEIIYCLVYLILIMYYMITEIQIAIRKRKAYVKQFWSYINWAIIACSWAGVAIHVFRQTEVKKLAGLLKTGGNAPINLQFFSYLDRVLTYLLAFCCFCGTIKILRLLRFNRRMSLLHLTLKKSKSQILGFFLIFSLVFMAFNSLFYLLFHSYIKQYATLLDTALTCFEMISIRFSAVNAMIEIDRLLAGITLFLFIFLAVSLLTNMFISIIVDNFNILRREQLKRSNEVELIQFTMEKIKQWLNIRSIQKTVEKTETPTAALLQKIDQLMVSIDKLYSDNKI